MSTFVFTPSQGLRVHTRRHKNPGRPKLVLFGAWPQTIRCWDGVWDGLSGSFDLLALDMPGFGRSDAAPELMSPVKMAGFVERFLVEQGFGRSHLVAPDVSAPVAFWLAANRPDLVETLVIADGLGTYPPKVSASLAALGVSGMVPPLRGLIGMASGLFVGITMKDGYRKFRPSEALKREYTEAYAGAGRLSGTFRYLASYPKDLPEVERALPRIEAPVLILWGAEDIYLMPSNAPKIAAKLKRAEVHVLDGVGHFSHEDAAPEFVRFISGWCARQPKAA